jgi:hypothetical protein
VKFNAHLLQTQQYAGDLGEGTVSGTAFGPAPIPPDTQINAPTSPSSALPGNSALFQREVPYRNAFIQRIFSSKRGTYQGNTAFLYNTFFDVTDSAIKTYFVQPHELPTMGQVWDYLMRPRSGSKSEADLTYFPGGVITKYVGDHFGADVDTTLTLRGLLERNIGGHIPGAVEWGNYSLVKKLYTILSKIITDSDPGAKYPIYASAFYGGTLTITSSTQETLITDNLYAGNSAKAVGTDIFQVRNDPSPYKYVLLNYNNVVATDPVGIYGKLASGDNYDDLGNYYFGGTNPFSLIDVSRYYLRRAVDGGSNYIDSHKYADGGYRWIEGTAAGSIGFYFYALAKQKSVVINEPSSAGVVVHTSPTTAYSILNYSGGSYFNFSFVFDSDATGLRLYRSGVASYIFGISNTGTAAKQLSLIPGDGVTGITTYFPLPKASLMGDQARFLTNQGEETFFVTATGAASIMKIYRGVTASNNYVRMLLSALSGSGIRFALDLPSVGSYSVRRVLSTPFMDGNSEFIVTNPTAAQVVWKALNFVAGCNANTISPYSGTVTTFPQTVKVGTATVNYLTEGTFGYREVALAGSSYAQTIYSPIPNFDTGQCKNVVDYSDTGFTIEVSGFYRITINGGIFTNTSVGGQWFYIKINGSGSGDSVEHMITVDRVSGAGAYVGIYYDTIKSFTAAEHVVIMAKRSSAAPILIEGGLRFSIQLVREGTTL